MNTPRSKKPARSAPRTRRDGGGSRPGRDGGSSRPSRDGSSSRPSRPSRDSAASRPSRVSRNTTTARPTVPVVRRNVRMDTTQALPTGALGVRAFAKVNLHLEVLRRRPDGYHDIETVLQSVGLYDTLHLVPRPSGLSMLCDAPGVPRGEDNLCMRAARALLAAAECDEPPRGVRLDLYKSIPVAAGCGGASADAAAVLVGLDHFWQLGLGLERLTAIAATLGSDVPFCVRGGTALARGRGERLVQLPDLEQTWFLLVFPGIPVRSEWAYTKLSMGLTRRPHALNLDRLKSILARYPEAARGFYNRLEDAVCPAHPQLAEIAAWLQQSGAPVAMMTGSGSGVFAAFGDQRRAERVRRALGRSDWRAMVVESVRAGVEFFR